MDKEGGMGGRIPSRHEVIALAAVSSVAVHPLVPHLALVTRRDHVGTRAF